MTTYNLISASIITSDGSEYQLKTGGQITINMEPPSPEQVHEVFRPPQSLSVTIDGRLTEAGRDFFDPEIATFYAPDGTTRRVRGSEIGVAVGYVTPTRQLLTPEQARRWLDGYLDHLYWRNGLKQYRYRNRIIARAGRHIGQKRRGSNGWR